MTSVPKTVTSQVCRKNMRTRLRTRCSSDSTLIGRPWACDAASDLAFRRMRWESQSFMARGGRLGTRGGMVNITEPGVLPLCHLAEVAGPIRGLVNRGRRQNLGSASSGDPFSPAAEGFNESLQRVGLAVTLAKPRSADADLKRGVPNGAEAFRRSS